MSSITEIQQAILSLHEADYLQLRHWFNELDWEKWDRQIEEDSESGKLDFLIAEAFEAKKRAHSRNYRCIGQLPASGGILSNSQNLFKGLRDGISACS